MFGLPKAEIISTFVEIASCNNTNHSELDDCLLAATWQQDHQLVISPPEAARAQSGIRDDRYAELTLQTSFS